MSWNSQLVYVAYIIVLSIFPIITASESDLKEYDVQLWQQSYRENQKILLALYTPEGCEKCESMLDTMTTLVDQPDMPEDIEIGKSSDPQLASKLGVLQLPSLVFLRDKSHAFYDGPIDIEQMILWTQMASQKALQRLDDDSFEHLTQASTGATTGDWLVAFFQEQCSTVLPILESVGVRIRQRTNVAKVDVSRNPILLERFSIQKCPEIILFKQGKMYRYELPKMDVSSLRTFAESWYKNSKAERIPVQKSSFDNLTENIALQIKQQLQGENRIFVLAGLCGFTAMVLVILVCCCRSVVGENTKQKKE